MVKVATGKGFELELPESYLTLEALTREIVLLPGFEAEKVGKVHVVKGSSKGLPEVPFRDLLCLDGL